MITTTPIAVSSLRFTRAQFYEILPHLNPDVHYELLGGVILVKPRANPPHAGTVTYFANRLARGLDGAIYQIQTQDALEIEPDEAPEPDVCVLTASPDYYSTRPPNGGDVSLLIEVGDTEPERNLVPRRALQFRGRRLHRQRNPGTRDLSRRWVDEPAVNYPGLVWPDHGGTPRGFRRRSFLWA